jgi:competence protein ComEC
LAGPVANVVAIPWWSLVVVPLALSGTALEALHASWGAWAWRLSASTFDLAWPLFQALAASPLALWWLPQPSWFALPMALLGGFWLLLPRGTPGKALALLLWLPLLWPQRGLPDRGEVELQVIDVGQGLSVLVRTSHHTLLYDTGPAVLDGFDAGESAVVPTLHALGVRRLDVITISHGDNDHAGGFAAVARTFPPSLVLTPDGAPPLPQGRACRAGLNWQWDGVRFRFLHPPRFFPYLGNEAGCVLRVESAHGVALLPADIGEVIEQALLHRDASALRADVVLMPHHGSGGSSTQDFVDATGARFAIASSGYDNRFRHPRPEVVERWGDAGAQVINTAGTGAVRVRMLVSGITVERERGIRPRSWDAVQRHARAIQAPAAR